MTEKAIILDIDGTIANIDRRMKSGEEAGHKFNSNDYWDHVLDGNLYPMDEPIEGAARCVNQHAQAQKIVYLSGRRTGTEEKSREWLLEHGFPDGEIIHRPKGIRNIDFKTDQVARIKDRYDVVCGVGNEETDRQAYEGNGVASSIVKTNKKWQRCPCLPDLNRSQTDREDAESDRSNE